MNDWAARALDELQIEKDYPIKLRYSERGFLRDRLEAGDGAAVEIVKRLGRIRAGRMNEQENTVATPMEQARAKATDAIYAARDGGCMMGEAGDEAADAAVTTFLKAAAEDHRRQGLYKQEGFLLALIEEAQRD